MGRKRLIAMGLGLVLACMSLLTACSQESRASYDTVTLSWGGIGTRDGVDIWIGNEVADRVYRRTDAHVQIICYDNAQLGNSIQLYDQIRDGNVDMGLITVYEDSNPKAGIVFLPLLTTDYDEFRRVYARGGDLWNYVAKAHEDQGVRLLGLWPNGYCGVGIKEKTSSEEAYIDPTTNNNETIRTPAMTITEEALEAVGFRTMRVDYEDTYRALRDGECDGVLSSGAYDVYMLYRDVLNWYIDYRLLADVYTLLINDDKFASLSEEDQQIIQDTVDEVIGEAIDRIAQKEAKALADLDKGGVTVITPSDSQRDFLRQYYRANVWPELAEDYDPSLIQTLTELTEPAEPSEDETP